MAADPHDGTRGVEAPPRSERINLRASVDTDAILRHAAALEHKSLSAFLLDAGLDRARALVEQERQLRLSRADFDAFTRALERPARVIPPLREIARRPRLIPEA